MLDSLHRRPRGRRAATVLAHLTGGRVPAPPPPDLEPVRREGILRALRRNEAPERTAFPRPVTRDLLARLDEGDRASIWERLDHVSRGWWEVTPEAAREHLPLVFAAHHEVRPVLEKTGLSTAAPPEDVHAMGRGLLAAGGDFWIADMLAAAATAAGAEFADGQRVLDFGCSSGRHLRVLQAWRPGVRWTGCDPNHRAIGWASEHLDGIEFFVSPQDPPLALDDGSLDAALAVSVWSHFDAKAAERWLEEMARLIRPGGVLVFTTQGMGSLAFYVQGGHIDEGYAATVAENLVAGGHAWFPTFGPEGDWGVKHPGWGMGYLTLEWLAARVLGDWTLEGFEPRRIDANQDLVALRRR